MIFKRQEESKLEEEENMYSGVTEADYAVLDATFKNLLAEVLPHIAGHPELEEVFADFITKVGMQSQTILQKFANDNHVKHLEVEDYKEKMFIMKQKLIKTEMLMLPLTKACNKLVNSIESAKESK